MDRETFDSVTTAALESLVVLIRDGGATDEELAARFVASSIGVAPDELGRLRREPRLASVMLRLLLASELVRVATVREEWGHLDVGRQLRTGVEYAIACIVAEVKLLYRDPGNPTAVARIREMANASPAPALAPIRPDVLAAVREIAGQLLREHDARMADWWQAQLDGYDPERQ
jgi:hypothetical protein